MGAWRKTGSGVGLAVLVTSFLLGGCQSSLVGASYKGDLDQVRSRLAEGVDVNVPQDDGVTALHAAAAGGQREAARLLIERGANVNAQGPQGATPLHVACLNSPDVALLLLAHGADPNLTGMYEGDDFAPGKIWAIHLAAQRGYTEVVDGLLEHGADVNVTGPNGQTALFYAVLCNRLETVKLLLDRGADPEMRTAGGKSAILLTVKPEMLDVAKVLEERLNRK